jgi:hypothetical protein
LSLHAVRLSSAYIISPHVYGVACKWHLQLFFYLRNFPLLYSDPIWFILKELTMVAGAASCAESSPCLPFLEKISSILLHVFVFWIVLQNSVCTSFVHMRRGKEKKSN